MQEMIEVSQFVLTKDLAARARETFNIERPLGKDDEKAPEFYKAAILEIIKI